jgi:hypothetical protein
MQLDDLKQAWTAHGDLLERSLAINERLLRETLLRKVRFALAPYVLCRVVEVVLGVAALRLVLPVLAAHVAEPRYLVAGGALAACIVAITALCAWLLVTSLQLDFGGPVTVMQRQVEGIKLVEYRCFKWALLGGVALWLPAVLVLFEAVTGVAALARVDSGYLLGNLLVGAAVLAAGQWLSRRHVERPDLSPRARRLVEALSGRALQRAAGHLAELTTFERDEA